MKRVFVTISSLLLSTFSHASGLYLYEIGTEDVGLAGAGQAARAQDASTVYSNPAGMTRLPGGVITGGIQALYGDAKYSLDNDAAVSGKSPGNVIGWFPGASMFYSQQINDDFSAGIGIYGNYGLGLDFGNWAGDSVIKKSTLVGLTVSPALAWKVNDRLSLGFAPGINYGFLSLTRDVNNNDEKQTDHDWALNYRFGLLFNLTQQTRLGLTWQSETRYHFNIDATARFPDHPNVPDYSLPIAAQVNTPEQLMLSMVHDFTPQWSLMGDLGWQDWSAYGQNQIAVTGENIDRDNRLKDTWHTAVGVQYRMNEQWRFNSGIAYDSSFYNSQSDTSLTMPSGEAWRFGVGAQYQVTEVENIGVAFEYLNMDSSYVSSPAIKGGYDDPTLYFMTLNYSYKF